MYLPTHFEETRLPVLHELVRSHPLGLLVTQAETGMEVNALPFLIDPERGPCGTLRDDAQAMVVFQGPQAYVSPGWYATKAETGKVVPTWNYVLVQARGMLKVMDDAAWVRRLVGELTERHESSHARPWRVEDAPADYIDTMLRAIVGIEIELGSLVGKWKVSQNRPAADRDGTAFGLDAQGGEAARQMARQVRDPGAPSQP